MKIREKFFLLIVFFCGSFLIITGAVVYTLSNKLLMTEYAKLTEDNLEYVVDITNRELRQFSNISDLITNNAVIQKRITKKYKDSEQLEKIIADKQVDDLIATLCTANVFKYLNALYIEGDQNKYYNSMCGTLIDNEGLEKILNFDEVWKNKITYVGVRKSNKLNDNNNVIIFTRNMLDKKNKPAGKIYIEISINYLNEILNSDRKNIDMRLTLIDKDNIVLFDGNTDNIGKKYVKQKGLDFTLEEPINKFGWKVICQTKNTISYDQHSVVIKSMMIMFLILLILVSLWIRTVWRKLIQPITEVSMGMRLVRRGDYSIRLRRKSEDEVGQLADDFNAMAIKLKDNVNKEVENTRKLKDAEYKTLQTQINPHFMYNSLNAIKYTASVQNLDNISSMITDLWILLRNASSIEGQIVTLKKEIEVIRAYVHIQEVRYKGKFEVFYDLNDEVLSMNLPKYIMQPFVENAIFHGIEPKRGLGTIWIKGYFINEEVVIQIKDDGIGMNEDTLQKLLNSKQDNNNESRRGFNCIGVSNVNERMKLLYGKDYGIKIKSQKNKGTTVTLRFPKMNYQNIVDNDNK